MIKILYMLLAHIALPFVLIKLLIKGFRSPDYWWRIPERFGINIKPIGNENVICIHAVSVGEVNATKPIIEYLKRHYPHYTLVITTMTPSGAKTVLKNYSGQVFHRYLPYDFPWAIKRFINRLEPQMLIVMETEIWPNLFYVFHQLKIPVLLLNARMSAKSFNQYLKIHRLVQDSIRRVDCIAAQTDNDADRLKKLGATTTQIKVTGNLKLDIASVKGVLVQGHQIRNALAHDRPVWIAGSTHQGEEQLLLEVFQQVLDKYPEALLIIAPRHIERAEMLVRLCQSKGYACTKKALNMPLDEMSKISVYILDTIGELVAHYAAADIAFVGGSLVNAGGQNMIEPVSVGTPAIVGSSTYNFDDICRTLKNREVVWEVSNIDQLVERVTWAFTNLEAVRAIGQSGQEYVKRHRGSAKAVYTLIDNYLH